MDQELIALKLRVLKLEDDLKKSKQENTLLKIELEGEKELLMIVEKGYMDMVKVKDNLEQKLMRVQESLSFESDSD